MYTSTELLLLQPLQIQNIENIILLNAGWPHILSLLADTMYQQIQRKIEETAGRYGRIPFREQCFSLPYQLRSSHILKHETVSLPKFSRFLFFQSLQLSFEINLIGIFQPESIVLIICTDTHTNIPKLNLCTLNCLFWNFFFWKKVFILIKN